MIGNTRACDGRGNNAAVDRRLAVNSVSSEQFDAPIVPVARCVLAFAALAAVLVDLWLQESSSVGERVSLPLGLLFALLAGYCLHSVLCARRVIPAQRALHWIDLLVCAGLLALTDGTSSIFFYFFFFAILAAAFAWGFREGLAVSVAALAVYVMVGILGATVGDELDRALIRGVQLLVFGYLLSHIGGEDHRLKRQLEALRDINVQWGPRFGADYVIASGLERLRGAFGATSCVLVMRTPGDPPRFTMHRSPAPPGQGQRAGSAVSEPVAAVLLGVPETLGAVYHDPAGGLAMRLRGHVGYDLVRRQRTRTHFAQCAALANLLETRAFLTAPFSRPDGTTGRIYVTAETHGFYASEIELLAQAAEALSAALERVRFVEELVEGAEQRERHAISRDLHDATLQPYIGLKLALDALSRDAGEANPLARRIAELADMAAETVSELRGYAESFRARKPLARETLLSLVRNQALRLRRHYGIEVAVSGEFSGELPGQLGAEAYQMVAEALSNILRHTSAKKAFVAIRGDDSGLLLEIGNESPAAAAAAPRFVPRSIAARSAALGGATVVEQRTDGYTVVRVEIPT